MKMARSSPRRSPPSESDRKKNEGENMSSNPYATPKATVSDPTSPNAGSFVPGGHGVPAGNGWAWIASGWELFKKQWGVWIGLGLIAFVSMLILSFIPVLG